MFHQYNSTGKNRWDVRDEHGQLKARIKKQSGKFLARFTRYASTTEMHGVLGFMDIVSKGQR